MFVWRNFERTSDILFKIRRGMVHVFFSPLNKFSSLGWLLKLVIACVSLDIEY